MLEERQLRRQLKNGAKAQDVVTLDVPGRKELCFFFFCVGVVFLGGVDCFLFFFWGGRFFLRSK